jgi:hypothetical protein
VHGTKTCIEKLSRLNLRLSLILTTIFMLSFRLSRQIPGYVPCNWPLLAPFNPYVFVHDHCPILFGIVLSSTMETAPFNNAYLQPYVVKFNTVVVMYLLYVLAKLLLFWHLFLAVFTLSVVDWRHRA